jgi:NTP pyrophosphatase (non-canonical NTP hydrolase)
MRHCDRMDLAQLQDMLRSTYATTDNARGVSATVAWITEELGELAQAVRKGTRDQQIHEIGDVLAWVLSLANQLDIDVVDAMSRFAHGCPKCGQLPCDC